MATRWKTRPSNAPTASAVEDLGLEWNILVNLFTGSSLRLTRINTQCVTNLRCTNEVLIYISSRDIDVIIRLLGSQVISPKILCTTTRDGYHSLLTHTLLSHVYHGAVSSQFAGYLRWPHATNKLRCSVTPWFTCLSLLCVYVWMLLPLQSLTPNRECGILPLCTVVTSCPFSLTPIVTWR